MEWRTCAARGDAVGVTAAGRGKRFGPREGVIRLLQSKVRWG